MTIVEPGAVLTPMADIILKKDQREGEPSGAPSQDRDADVDDFAASLRRNCLTNIGQSFIQQGQTGEDVAKVIRECIYKKNPPVRIQTSVAMSELAKEILVDPTGHKALKISTGMLQSPKI